MEKTKYITQIELAKRTNKKRQWINFLVSKDLFNTEIILGRKVIVYDQKVINFLRENG
jgi:hypothetical protein